MSTTLASDNVLQTQPASDRTAKSSRLLELPAELRNTIYRYALLSKSAVAIDKAHDPPLLGACRQIRNEALALYWSENTFSTFEPLLCPHHESVSRRCVFTPQRPLFHGPSPLLVCGERIGAFRAQLISNLEITYRFTTVNANPNGLDRASCEECFPSILEPAQWWVRDTIKAGVSARALKLLSATHRQICVDREASFCDENMECRFVARIKEHVKRLEEGKGRKRKTELERLHERNGWEHKGRKSRRL